MRKEVPLSQEACAFVGTSGWNYKHWRGCLYEAGFPQRLWLTRIAAMFPTVEVNTSFYRIPQRKTVEGWAAATPASFRFALKLWRGITHYRKLVNAGDLTERFLESAEALQPERRAPLLIQLPPSQGPDLAKLEAYVHEFRGIAPTPWELAVEFRHDGWLTAGVYAMLTRLGVGLCLHDMHGRGAAASANDAPFVYMRRHGSGTGHYAGSYSPEQIRADAEAIAGWVGAGRSVYVYYNNDLGGHAFRNASDLRSTLQSWKVAH